MKKQIFIISILIGILTIFSIKTQAQSHDNNAGSFSMINEYGTFFGRNTVGITGVFVVGYSTPSDKDMFGVGVAYDLGGHLADGIPVFVNYRHSFHPDRKFSPIANVAAGVRINLFNDNDPYGLYATAASGFQTGVFSFTGGFCLRSLGTKEWYPGFEIKCGFRL